MSRLSSADRAVIRKLAETQAEHGRQIRRLARRSPARYVAQEGGTSEVYDDDGNLRAVVGELDDGTYGVAVGTDRETLEPLATTGQVAVKTTTTRGPNPPDDAPGTAGDQWFQTDDFGRVLGWWVHDGTLWQPQELTGVMLAVDALDGRLITGSTLQTAAAGQRVVIRVLDDYDVGLVEFWSGVADEFPGSLAASLLDGYSVVELTSPTQPGQVTSTVRVRGSAPGDTEIDLIADKVDVTGLLRAFGGVRVYGGVTADGGVHGLDIYADGQTGTGTDSASLTAQGRLVRTPSTRRVKRDIQPMTLETAEKVLDIEPVTFRLKAEDAENGPVYPGFIAEQAAEAGADLWVTRDMDGEPAGIRYAEVVAALVAITNDARAKHDALAERVAELEAANRTLLAKVNKLTPRL